MPLIQQRISRLQSLRMRLEQKQESILDAPAHIEFVDAGVPDGGNSIGVKGLGEPPLIAAGAAIGNAIFNALGVRLRHYPITPAKILAALSKSAI